MVKTDKNLKAFLITEEEAYKTKDLATYTQYLNDHNKTLDVATLKTKAWAFAKNAALNIGFTLIMIGVSKVIDNMVNSQENAIKKADEFIKKYEEQRDALVSNKQTIDSISSDYENLAKGVDSLGRNVSLNSDEYARYNEIVNQIADMFPHMVQGYTDEGNAIIKCKGDVEELTQAYKDQKDAAQDAIIVGSAEVFAGFKASTDKDPEWIWEESGLLQMKELVDKIVATGGDVEKIQDIINDLGGNSLVIGDVFDKIGLDKGWFGWNTQDAEYISENIKKFQSLFNTLNTEVEAQAAKIKPIMQAYLEQSDKFQLADDKVQDMVKQIVGQFDAEFYSQFDTETQMASWVEENVIDKLRGNKDLVSDFSVMFDLQTKFNAGDITVAEYQEKLTAFLSLIDTLPDETQKAIKLLFGIKTGEDGTETSDFDTMLNNVKKKFKGKFEEEIGGLSLPELEILSNLDISPKGIESWSEVETLLANAGKEANKMTDSLKSITEAKSALDELFDAYEKDMKLTADDVASILEENPEYIQYLTKVGDSYKVNQKALDDWNKAHEEQQRLIDKQMGSNQYATEYNPVLDTVSSDTWKPESDGDGDWEGGSEALDGLIAKNKELNESFAEGSISVTDYFNSISDSITDNGLEDALDDINGKFDETTDKIEATVGVLAGELSDAMIQASKRYELGKTSVGDYIDELDAGLEAQMKLLKSTYDLTEGVDENGKKILVAADDTDEAAKKAAESFNFANDVQDDIDVVNEFADAMESYNDRIMQYVGEDNITLTDSILGDVQLFNTHMDNVTDSLVAFAGTSAEHYNTVLQQVMSATGKTREEVQSLIGTSWQAVAENGDALQAAAGQNMSAINGLSQGAMENARTTVTNASQAIGGVLSALGEAISGFEYHIKGTPYIEGDFDFKIVDGKPQLSLGSFGFDITGSGGSSLKGLSQALSEASNYFTRQGNNNAGGYSGYGATPNTTTPAGKRPTSSGSGGGGNGGSGSKKDPAKEAEEQAKKELEALKTGLEFREKILEKYKAAIDLTDFGLDTAEENDFALRADLLNNKMEQLTSYGEAMREEFDRVASIIPKTGEEAEALASHLESLGNDMRSNITAIRETQVAMEQLKVDSIVSVGNYYLDDLNDALSDIEKRIEILSSDNSEDYKYTSDILSMKTLLPTRSDTGDIRNKRRGADTDVIEAEQETQDILNDILETQIEKNEKLREDEKKALLANMETVREECKIKLDTALQDYNVHADSVRTETDNLVSYTTNAINNMKIEIPKPDTSKFTQAANDIETSLSKIHTMLGETPGSLVSVYAQGTPSGNAKASNLGIAGENYKPEILIDKNTGKAEYITSPTLIDTTKTDVVGEKQTASIPKFAEGTMDAETMYRGLKNVTSNMQGYGAVKSARSFLGIPYLWGGTSRAGVDCSGLTYLAWQSMGVDIGRTTYFQYPNTLRVTRDQLRPGDLVFNNFGAHGLEGPGHVGMYVGYGRTIESPRTGDVVKYGSLDKWVEYGRPVYASGTPNGNTKAKRFGIAGENFKPEILIDKATGKTRCITCPTLIDITKTDVIGEKQTASLPKFAEGTISPAEIASYIREKYPEITDAGIAAILGNIEQESSFNPKAKAIESYGGGNNSQVARWGLFQIDDARIKAYDPNIVWSDVVQNGTWQEQIDIALAEGRYGNSGMGNLTEYNVWDRVLTNSALSAAEAARQFDKLYERSDGTTRETRAINAEKYYGQIQDNTIAIDAASVATSTENQEVKEIQDFVSLKMDEIGKEASKIRHEQLRIYEQNLSDKDELLELFKLVSPVADEAAGISYEAYNELQKRFTEWLDKVENAPDLWSQETFDSFMDGLDELEDKTRELEEIPASFKESLISYMDKELSEIDEAIEFFGYSKEFTDEKLGTLTKFYKANVLSEEDYLKQFREISREGMEGELSEIDVLIDHYGYYADYTKKKQDILQKAFEDKIISAKEFKRENREAYLEGMEGELSEIDELITSHGYSKELFDKKQAIIQEAYEGDYIGQKEYWRKTKEIAREGMDTLVAEIDNYISERNFYNDWELFGDTQVDAIKRQLKAINEIYSRGEMEPEEYNKLVKQYEQKLYDSLKNDLVKSLNFDISKIRAQKTMMQEQFDIENSIASARHEINKELEKSKTMYEWLDKDTRKLLFNEEDYIELAEELNEIQEQANILHEEYSYELQNATSENIDEINSKYQAQYDLLMKSYEIKKADLEIAKKQQKLNNVLNERNVRMFIDGQWKWVANQQDVISAQEELAEAKYKRDSDATSLSQSKALNELTTAESILTTTINNVENGVVNFDKEVKGINTSLGTINTEIVPGFSGTLTNATNAINGFISLIQSYKIHTPFSYSEYLDYSTEQQEEAYTPSGKEALEEAKEEKKDYYRSRNFMDDIVDALLVNDIDSVVALNRERTNKIAALNLDEEIYSDEEVIEKAKELINSRQSLIGVPELNDSEMYMSVNGHLVPINNTENMSILNGGKIKSLFDGWSMSDIGINVDKSYVNRNSQQIDQSQDNRIIINSLVVDSGSHDGRNLADALRRYVGNH